MSATHGGQSHAMPQTADREEALLLDWTVHLLRREPGRAWAAAAAIAGAGMLGYVTFHSILFAALGALLVGSAASEYLLPIRYRLTSRGIRAQNGLAPLEMEWGSVRRVIDGGSAVKLSPFSRPCRLDATRGIVLRFNPEGMPGNRAEVLAIVERQRREGQPSDA